jgi:hypothetical protein
VDPIGLQPPIYQLKNKKYMFVYCRGNDGHNLNTELANRSFGNMLKLKYLGIRVTN